MASTVRGDVSAPPGELPDDMYIGFVDELVADVVPVFLSAVTVTCGEIAAALSAKNVVLLYGATAQLLVAAGRLYFLNIHSRSIPSATIAIASKQARMDFFLRGAGKSGDAVAVDFFGILPHGKQLHPIHRRLNDDRICF